MTRPTRDSTAGRAYLDLQNLARRNRRTTSELLTFYALEGVLARLSISPYADQCVLKGGMLLAALDTRRPTRDIDLHATQLPNDTDTILEVVRRILAIDLDDGLVFSPETAIAQTIREGSAHTGVRVRLHAMLHRARIAFHIDVSVGDPISPPPQIITLPRVLTGTITLRGYPLTMVYAEKIVTAVLRAETNTRLRDFADLYTLSRHHPTGASDLIEALTTTAAHHQATLRPLQPLLAEWAHTMQPEWRRWLDLQQLDDQLPHPLSEVLTAIATFTDPILDSTISTGTWNPHDHSWEQPPG